MLKKKVWNQVNSQRFPRYETSPGIQAQVDWKEDISIKNKFGKIFTFHVFSYKLGYSRYPVFIYKSSRTREDVIDCLIASFKNTGGVPKEILFDNMSSLVTFKDGHATISPKIQAFAKDFNFKIKRCKPYHPFTKVKVEAANKIHCLDTTIWRRVWNKKRPNWNIIWYKQESMH